jgi:hypothetical protein
MSGYNNPQYPFQFSETYNPDRLIAGVTPPVTKSNCVLVSGQTLQRGSLVGKITASGKLTLSLAASSDGSQTPYGILADYYDASAGDVNCAVFVAGVFNADAVIFGTGQTEAALYDTLRGLGIFLKDPVLAS